MSPSDRGPRVLATGQGSRMGPFGLVDWALLLGVALIWGSSYLLIEICLETLRPSAIAWVRTTLGLLLLAGFPMARRPVERSDRLPLFVLGMTWIAVPFLLFPTAQQHIDSSLAGMLNALVPIFSTLITAILLRTPPRIRQVLGIGLGFVGAISIGLPAARGSEAGTWGVVLVVMATMLYGLSLNTAVPLQQKYGAPAVMLRALGVGSIVLAPFGIAGLSNSSWSVTTATAILVLGTVNTGAAYVVMASLVGRVGSARGSLAVYFLPIIATILGVAFRSEVVFPIQLVGIGMVLLGAWLASRRDA